MGASGDGVPQERDRTLLERVSVRQIVIRRAFRAPARLVFDAWTRPELVRLWWAPDSQGVSMAECDADPRPGGTYRYVLALGSGDRMAFSGTYREVEPPSRLVYTQVFEPVPGAEALVTVTFVERNGTTGVTIRETYPSKDALDTALQSGMEEGMRGSFGQLDGVLASRTAGRGKGRAKPKAKKRAGRKRG